MSGLFAGIVPGPIHQVPADLAVVFFFEEERPLRGAAAYADWRLCGALSRLIQRGKLAGRFGEAALVPTSGGLRNEDSENAQNQYEDAAHLLCRISVIDWNKTRISRMKECVNDSLITTDRMQPRRVGRYPSNLTAVQVGVEVRRVLGRRR